MTRQELMQVQYIKIEINELKEELQKVREKAFPRTTIGGIVSGRKSFRHSRVEEVGIKAVGLEKKIREKIEELEKIYEEVMSFIMDIDDSQTRLIFKLKCLDCVTWNQVADKIGGGNTEYSVKKRFYRYLDKQGIE